MSNKNLYSEKYRPQVHFSPMKNWANDPNGLVYANGVYHLFYQHNPFSDVWGNMSWGHATSTDMLRWQHQPCAIEPGSEPHSFIFSGGAVHDFNGSSGLGGPGAEPLVAFYTHSGDSGQQQRQCASYSLDDGLTWLAYEGNPVIANPGLKDFRDPKVFFYAPQCIWVMLVAAGQLMYIYRSKNLLDWTLVSTFGERLGAHGGDWECPDLFPLAIDGDSNNIKWVMLASINPGAPNGGSATQYFIGDFDGTNFIADDRQTRWMDYGPDSYAGITWEAAPGALQERVLIAWMSNWNYALNLPTQPWRGQMTLPRALNLVTTNEGVLLSSTPVNQVSSLRGQRQAMQPGTFRSASPSMSLPSICELKLTIGIKNADRIFGIKLYNEQGEQVEIYLDKEAEKLVLDRSKTHIDEDLKFYPYSYTADINIQDLEQLNLHIVVDSCSIEVFCLGGTVVMTALFFTHKYLNQIQLFCDSGEAELIDGEIWELKSTW